MKILLLLFTTVVFSTALPAPALDKLKLQHILLAEIIQNLKEINDSLTTEHVNFCKAGMVLSAYKAEKLGLKATDWLLHRKLVAYTRDTHCRDPATKEQINLRQLLDNILRCAQKEYSKPLSVSALSS